MILDLKTVRRRLTDLWWDECHNHDRAFDLVETSFELNIFLRILDTLDLVPNR